MAPKSRARVISAMLALLRDGVQERLGIGVHRCKRSPLLRGCLIDGRTDEPEAGHREQRQRLRHVNKLHDPSRDSENPVIFASSKENSGICLSLDQTAFPKVCVYQKVGHRRNSNARLPSARRQKTAPRQARYLRPGCTEHHVDVDRIEREDNPPILCSLQDAGAKHWTLSSWRRECNSHR